MQIRAFARAFAHACHRYARESRRVHAFARHASLAHAANLRASLGTAHPRRDARHAEDTAVWGFKFRIIRINSRQIRSGCSGQSAQFASISGCSGQSAHSHQFALIRITFSLIRINSNALSSCEIWKFWQISSNFANFREKSEISCRFRYPEAPKARKRSL